MIEYKDLYGTSRWATENELHAAEMIGTKGLYFGHSRHGRALSLPGDMPLITFAGSGSGKGRDVAIHNLLTHRGHTFATDPKGELAAICAHGNGLNGKPAFCINPFFMHCGPPWSLPSHSVNPLDVLRRDSPNLTADSALIMEALIPPQSQGDSYWTEKPREWGQSVLLWMVMKFGKVTLPAFYTALSKLYGNPAQWGKIAADMANFPNIEIQRVIGEMTAKQRDAGAEFSGITGSLYNNLRFIADPAISESLQGRDFSLSILAQPKPVSVYLMMPVEYMRMYAPYMRLIASVTAIYKQRAPASSPVLFLIDEAAQLGHFEVLERAYSFGRGVGLRPWAFFQSMGQLVDIYGQAGAQSIISNAQMRQFFGVRDYETAQYVSDMAGAQTVEYFDPSRKVWDRARRMQAFHALSENRNLGTAAQYMAASKAARTPQIARRQLIMADEVMRLPGDQQICFVADKGLHPVRAYKVPYYKRNSLKGLYMPNPYHMNGKSPVEARPVPQKLAHLPQFRRLR